MIAECYLLYFVLATQHAPTTEEAMFAALNAHNMLRILAENNAGAQTCYESPDKLVAAVR